MRKLLLSLILPVLLLTGCASWTAGEYQTIVPHEEAYSDSESIHVQTVSDRAALQTALHAQIAEHSPEAALDVSQYGDDLEADMVSVFQALKREPLVDYAVRSYTLEMAEIGARRMASVKLYYRRSQEQVASIQTVWGKVSMQREVEAALERADARLTVQMNGYTAMDFDQIISKYYLDHRDSVMECPKVTSEVYPKEGNVRIVEVNFLYATDRERLLEMRRETQSMLSSAVSLVRGQSDARLRAERLYALIRPLYSEEMSTSTPVYSLVCEGRGDSRSVAEVYKLLCRQCGMNCLVVEGTRAGEDWCWNLVELDGTYYHTDILSNPDPWELVFRFDDEMDDYAWETDDYPASQRPSPVPEETQPGGTADTEEG